MLAARVAHLRTLLNRASTRPGGMYPVFWLATTRDLDDEERAAMSALIAASPLAAAFADWTARKTKECVASLGALEPALAHVHVMLADLSKRDENLRAKPYPELPAPLGVEYTALLKRFFREYGSGREIYATSSGFDYYVNEASALLGSDENACLARGAMAWGSTPPRFAFEVLPLGEILERTLVHTATGVSAYFTRGSHVAALDECPDLLPVLAIHAPPRSDSDEARVVTPPPPPIAPTRITPSPRDAPTTRPRISVSEAAQGKSSASFATASELRDALLASYPDAAFFNAPVVGITRGRDIDTFPAWGWLQQLLRTRTDWWPVLGIALEHAAHDGGDLARRALADLLETYSTESIVLLPWTELIANEWPDVCAPSESAFGQPDHRLATIVARQRTLWDEQQAGGVNITIFDGKKGAASDASVKTAADLESALARSAKAGMVCAPDEGPWSWLVSASLLHHWLVPMIPPACAKLAAGGIDIEVCAMLDWFSNQYDLWRYRDLLEEWSRTPPPWWNEPARTRKPRGWSNRPRWAPTHETLGEVARAALVVAQSQAATPPIVDLIQLNATRLRRAE